jgi:hypothetical protein
MSVQDFYLSLCFYAIRIHFPETRPSKKLSNVTILLYKIQDCSMFFITILKARPRNWITLVYEFAKLMQI